MKFTTPDGTVAFEIPDEWWTFAEKDKFSDGNYYPYLQEQVAKVLMAFGARASQLPGSRWMPGWAPCSSAI